jgi:outer membrane protein assembly factor BamB
MKNMKKRWIYVLIIIFAVIIAVGGIFSYPMYKKYGLGELALDGKEDAVPEAIPTPPPLSNGASDWISWRGPKMDGKSDFTGMNKDWSHGLPKDWEVGYLCKGEESVAWSGPIIRGNRLVVTGRDGDEDLVFCLEATTGDLIWTTAYEAPTDPKFGTGPRATPCIDGDRVYTYGRAGDLACWLLFDGSLVWRKNVMDYGGALPNWGFSSSPLVLGELVIVQGGGDARLIAFDKANGEVRWKSPGGEAGYATAVPVTFDSTTHLLHFHGTGLALVDTVRGSILWEHPWETEYNVNAATPIVRNDTVFITSGYRMGCEWLKFSETGVEVIRNSDVISSQLSDQVLIGDYLYGYTANANNSGPFKCVSFTTGEEMWSTKKIGGGSVIFVDSLLVCFDVKGNLHLLEPSPDAFTKKGELRNAIPRVGQESWTPPAVANGKLYLRYMHKLVCYDLSTKPDH